MLKNLWKASYHHQNVRKIFTKSSDLFPLVCVIRKCIKNAKNLLNLVLFSFRKIIKALRNGTGGRTICEKQVHIISAEGHTSIFSWIFRYSVYDARKFLNIAKNTLDLPLFSFRKIIQAPRNGVRCSKICGKQVIIIKM